ncbi:hypothetical protein [Thiolapillus sp.]
MRFAEEFLHHADGFSHEQQDTPWGEKDITIDFLGGPYVFDGLNQAQINVIKQRFSELICTAANGKAPAIHTHICKLPETHFKIINTKDWEYWLDFDYQQRYLRIAGLRFIAHVQLEPHIEAWMWTPDDKKLVANSAFENIFRVIVAYRLLARGGMVLHSAGLARDKKAWLFIGRSGAGKSTISRLGESSGLTILSDDMNAIVPQDEQYLTEQLPFAGEHGQTALTKGKFSVQAVYYLQKSDNNRLRETPAAKRLAELMVCSPFVNSDPYRYAVLAKNLAALRKKTEGGNLEFRLDGGFQKLLKR